MTTDAERSLKDVILFAGLPAEVLRSYEQRCRWCVYSCGQQIIDCETGSSEVFFVISGAVRVVNYSFSGRQVTFANLRHGDLFGELAAIDGGPRCATVVATAETLLAIMPPDTLCDAMARSAAGDDGMLRIKPSPSMPISRAASARPGRQSPVP
jgi:CRP/FNR family transcriptional regulator, cyclic AMP receptor protein